LARSFANIEFYKFFVTCSLITPFIQKVISHLAMNNTLIEIRKIHIEIEHYLQNLATKSSTNQCAACTNVCCKEEICNESINSDFLRFILGDKTKEYNKKNGWFDQSSGCTLNFGRPIVCYEFFCSKFDEDSQSKNLQVKSKEFSQVYAKVFRNQHILEIDNINSIPEKKLQKLLEKLKLFKTLCN
jgi:hypothetical protein